MASDLPRGWGSIEKNGNRYWWNVKLPGEKVRQRIPLAPDGTDMATDDYEVAVAIAKEQYRLALAKHETGNDNTIAGLVRDFVKKARRDYKVSDEANLIERYLRPLVERCPMMPAEKFGPMKAKQIRQHLANLKRGDGESRYVRAELNRHVKIWRRMFRWAVSEERVLPDVLVALQAIDPLKQGRCEEVRESEPVETVDPAHVLAILDFTSPQISAMLRLQLLTGMRPQEVCVMRPCDIDMASRKAKGVWVYTPARHKTQWKGKKRPIILGPKAQEILAPFLVGRKTDASLFSPAEADQWRRDLLHEKRTTPAGQGNEIGTNRKDDPERKPGEVYDTRSYRRAVTRAIEKANRPRIKANAEREARGETPEPLIPHFHPHQIRHTKGTQVRAEFGLDAAQVVLGHSTARTTEIYAEADLEKAIEVARLTG